MDPEKWVFIIEYRNNIYLFKSEILEILVHYIWYNVLLSIEVLMTNKSLNGIQL